MLLCRRAFCECGTSVLHACPCICAYRLRAVNVFARAYRMILCCAVMCFFSRLPMSLVCAHTVQCESYDCYLLAVTWEPISLSLLHDFWKLTYFVCTLIEIGVAVNTAATVFVYKQPCDRPTFTPISTRANVMNTTSFDSNIIIKYHWLYISCMQFSLLIVFRHVCETNCWLIVNCFFFLLLFFDWCCILFRLVVERPTSCINIQRLLIHAYTRICRCKDIFDYLYLHKTKQKMQKKQCFESAQRFAFDKE